VKNYNCMSHKSWELRVMHNRSYYWKSHNTMLTLTLITIVPKYLTIQITIIVKMHYSEKIFFYCGCFEHAVYTNINQKSLKKWRLPNSFYSCTYIQKSIVDLNFHFRYLSLQKSFSYSLYYIDNDKHSQVGVVCEAIKCHSNT